MKALTKENIHVIDGSDAVIFFTATWDVIGDNTSNFLNTITDAQQLTQNLYVYWVDYDLAPELAKMFSVRDLPIVFFVRNGKAVRSVTTCENQEDWNKLILNALPQ